MSADDAHAVVRNTLEGCEDGFPGVQDLRLADLNETEREHAVRALFELHDLDKALAERSALDATDVPWRSNEGEN